MKASFRTCLKTCFSLAAIFAASCVLAAPSPAPSASPSPESASASGGSGDDGDDFDITVLPAGEPVKGIKIPYYGSDGTTLQMTMAAEQAKRIDDTRIEMENLAIEANSEDGRKFFVEFPSSVFNIETRILTGDKGVLIKREDFEIRGDAAEFDVKSRFGKVLGNVKMTIFNTDEYE